MTDVGRHPRIRLLTLSEVEEIAGHVGNFKVTVRKKARFVDEGECTACGDCVKVCPVVVPDEFEHGFSSRKAIYKQFAQAVPASYLIDMQHCLGNNPIACVNCMDACEKKCINLNMEDEILSFSVGTIIVASGMSVFDPTPLNEYGYTTHENVITSLEFERLIGGAGPTHGHLVRPSDEQVPQRIGFIQCVGSRTHNRGNPYCSNVCCMNTVKDTLLIKEHYPDAEVYVFYMDLRAFGKGFEELLRRSKETGVHYIRGLPGGISADPLTGNLRLKVENTTTTRVEEHVLDLIVLAVGLEPREDLRQLSSLLNISQTSEGFLMEAHPKLRPVDSPTAGIFFAGCVEAPKDIKDSVTQAGAAAARSAILLNAGAIRSEAIKAVVNEDKCTACGVCVRVCPYGAVAVDMKAKTPAEVITAACAGCGTCGAECKFEAITMQHFTNEQIIAQVDAALEVAPERKILAFLCNWCSYAGGDLAGSSRLKYPASTRFIRTMCSGRVDERFILAAFERGAAMVLLSGCHFGDCHYIDANHWTVRRADSVWNLLERLGIRPERFQLEWISAAEGIKFAETMRWLETLREKVTMEEVEHTKKVLAEFRLTKRLGKRAKKKSVAAAEV